eukprot:gene7013-7572_t
MLPKFLARFYLICEVYFFVVVGIAIYERRIPEWDAEIDASLKRNFKFCPYRIVTHLNSSAASSEEFIVERIYPSKSEFRPYQDVPITLTKAHKDVTAAASVRGYNYEKWGKEPESRWEVPSNHPGQDRRNCINMTQVAATDGKIYSFYESFKRVDRAYYISKARNAFIHPSGAVMTSCGYYMGQELCENRWDYARDWNERCKDSLQKNNYSWDIFFNQTLQQQLSPTDYDNLIEGCADNTDLGKPKQIAKFKVNKENRVFIISSLWDYNYHHFIADSLARLTRYYSFLKNNPDIKIHLRYFEEYDDMRRRNNKVKTAARKMREQILTLLGFPSHRYITGPILANEVYIPRAMRCSYALSNPMEIRLLNKILLNNVRAYMRLNYPDIIKFTDRHTVLSSPVMKGHHLSRFHHKSSTTPQQRKLEINDASDVIAPSRPVHLSQFNLMQLLPPEFIERSGIFWPSTISNDFIERNSWKERHLILLQRYAEVSDDRDWNDETFHKTIIAFAQAFPNHAIIPLSSKKYVRDDYCFACDLFLINQADVLVGAHGAGLTNMMYMPVNSLVVEIVGSFTDVNMPVCGYYGPYAAIFGHHHYLYAYHQHDNWPYLIQQAADESCAFFHFIKKRKVGAMMSDDFVVRVENSTGTLIEVRP